MRISWCCRAERVHSGWRACALGVRRPTPASAAAGGGGEHTKRPRQQTNKQTHTTYIHTHIHTRFVYSHPHSIPFTLHAITLSTKNKAKHCIDLRTCKSLGGGVGRKKHACDIMIETDERAYHLRAPTLEEAELWLNVLCVFDGAFYRPGEPIDVVGGQMLL
jgi:hypothetical protein